MLTELLTKQVWKRPEEGKHTVVFKQWTCINTTNKATGEVVEYLQCTIILDSKREMTQNFFERDVSFLSSALVNKYFEEGATLVELLNKCVSESTEIECWIKYNTNENNKEYTNFYWYEPKEETVTETTETISLGNVSKEDLMNMESLPL